MTKDEPHHNDILMSYGGNDWCYRDSAHDYPNITTAPYHVIPAFSDAWYVVYCCDDEESSELVNEDIDHMPELRVVNEYAWRYIDDPNSPRRRRHFNSRRG